MKKDNPQLEQLKKDLFGSVITSQVSNLGRFIYQVNEGKDNKEALMNIFIILHNLRNLTYSVKMREIGNFLNYFENYIDFLIKTGNSKQLKHIILVHQSWNCLMTNFGKLTENPYATLNFIVEEKNIMEELEKVMGKPKKRKYKVLTQKGLSFTMEQIDVLMEEVNSPDEILSNIKSSNYDCLILNSNPELIKMVRKIDKRLKIIFISKDNNISSLYSVSKISNLLLIENKDTAKINTYLHSLLAELS